MRAQMVWEVYQHHREPESRMWIDEALIALAQVKEDTVALMVALHKKNGYMRALGFGSRVKYGQIFDRIGSSSSVDMFDKRLGGVIPSLGTVTFPLPCLRHRQNRNLIERFPTSNSITREWTTSNPLRADTFIFSHQDPPSLTATSPQPLTCIAPEDYLPNCPTAGSPLLPRHLPSSHLALTTTGR